MEYNNATIEGRSKLLIIGLPERTTIKTKQNKIFDQNSMSIENIPKSNSHQIKPKQINLTNTSLEKICRINTTQHDCPQYDWPKCAQKEQTGAKFKKYFSMFENN